MRKLLRALILCLMGLRVCGGDFAALQIVAWGGMVGSRLSDEGLLGALESTFDGMHPCALCTALDAARNHDPGDPDAPPAPDSPKCAKEPIFWRPARELAPPRSADPPPSGGVRCPAARRLALEPALPPPRC